MPEAITKYAINSTLGTSDFKPLDKIFNDSIVIVSSDFVLKILIGEQTRLSNAGKTAYFTSNFDGVIKIQAKLTGEIIGNTNVYLSCTNSSNDIVAQKTTLLSKDTDSVFMNVNVKKGESYTVKISGPTSTYFFDLCVCGHTIFGKPIV